MRIAIDAPAVRSLSANEKMVYQMLKEGKTPREIAKKLHLALGDVTDLKYNSHDVMPDTVVNLITSIREKGWDISTDNKEDNEMARKSRFDAEEKRSIVTEYRSGATMAQIAKKHDTVKSTEMQHLHLSPMKSSNELTAMIPHAMRSQVIPTWERIWLTG